MHIPKNFKQNDPVQFEQLINKYPFASLITNSKSELEVNHIPLILNQSNEKQVLHGHIAKANPLWKNLKGKSEVLVVFNGPNCYISPNYYPTKKETGKVVPTWNYVVLHIKGTISFIHDNQWKLNSVNNLTKQHENEQPIPWSVSDAPDEYIQKMLPAIVGLEIEILSSTGQWKVSQNQPEQNKQGVIAGLSQESESNYQKIAKLVANNAVKIC
ncbi:Transcriptional regulator [uncultured Candidatus Thioglobus sp.]|nr:Transcriptional regulator [uncultured Candidatus Thioglobus sp.]